MQHKESAARPPLADCSWMQAYYKNGCTPVKAGTTADLSAPAGSSPRFTKSSAFTDWVAGRGERVLSRWYLGESELQGSDYNGLQHAPGAHTRGSPGAAWL